MIKSVIVSAMLLLASIGAAGSASANTGGICDYLSDNPSVYGAENFIIAAAEVVVENNLDANKVGEYIAYDVINNCPQYVGIVLQATTNLGG